MFVNKGKRDILIFPKFDNIDKIQEIRDKYDRLSSLVPPHITLVFPFYDEISNTELIDKLLILLKNFSAFDVTFNGLSFLEDNYIFLNCTDGAQNLISLHDKIYKEILPSHFKSSIIYTPHITLGQSCNKSEFKHFNYVFRTLVDEISVELIGENEESIIIDNIKLHIN